MKLTITYSFVFLLIFSLASPYIFAANLYQWVDKDGTVNISNTPPPENQTTHKTHNVPPIDPPVTKSAFTEVSEKDMDKLYQNPPGVKNFKSGYILHKPSVKKIGNKLYESKIIQVVSHASSRWDIRIDCKNRKLAYGCGQMWDNNNKLINKTKSCSSGSFEPFEVPKDNDWKEVISVFCERYDQAPIIPSTPSTPGTTSTGKDFFFKCLDAYPYDANICVKGELTRNSFDTVERWLKQWVAEHPNTGKK